MIIGIEGGLGSGKTVLMVRYLLGDFLQGKAISCNISLFGIDYTPLDVMGILEMDKANIGIVDMTVAIDEITVFMDCRLSASRINRVLSYFVLQSRKRGVNFYYTSQDISMCDKRLTRHTDILVECYKIYDSSNNEIDGIRGYSILDFRDRRSMKKNRFALDITKYYKYYDTNEYVLPPLKEDEKKEK